MLSVVVVLLLVASVGGFYAYRQLNPAPTCASPLGGARVLKTQLAPPTTIGGITEFALPTPDRAPNAPSVAPDGSVWFAERSVAGVAHFYPDNRTLVEYAWPYNYPAPPSSGGICGDKTDVWGTALWDGKVWASDPTGNQLVAMDPSTGQFTTIKLSGNSSHPSYPYELTVGPDNNTLWFPELFSSKIGELSADGTLHEFALPGGINAEPSQVTFLNSTTGFYSDVGQGPGTGGVYSFDPRDFSPKLVGGQKLTAPSGIAVASGALWVALHGASSVASYNFTTRAWSYYPTTPVSWNPITLPYFVNANGSSVWLNEHYGNRMARIDPASGSMTEYSESSGVINGSFIGNTLTFALGGGRAWFAELTGNTLGYVDASYTPGFSTSIEGNRTLVVNKGSSVSVNFVVHSTAHQGELNITFADSESLTSAPGNLTFTAPSTSFSPPLGGESKIKVTITASQSLNPGTYGAILTASDGSTYVSSVLRIIVPA